MSAFLHSTMLVPPLGRVFNYYEICADCGVGGGGRWACPRHAPGTMHQPAGRCCWSLVVARTSTSSADWDSYVIRLRHTALACHYRSQKLHSLVSQFHIFALHIAHYTLGPASVAARTPGELIYLSVGQKLSQFI